MYACNMYAYILHRGQWPYERIFKKKNTHRHTDGKPHRYGIEDSHMIHARPVMDYLAKNATSKTVQELIHGVDRLEDLKHFKYVETDTGRDQGLNVREKSKNLVELLTSKEKLQIEREKARIARERLHSDRAGGGGISSDDFRCVYTFDSAQLA